MIKAINLSKTFYQGRVKIEAVRNAQIEIQKGESILITGPSGAGKSTFLHMLGGFDKPTKGDLLFDGINFYKIPDKVRSKIRNEKVGFVFQFYHLLPEFNVMENVMLPALMRKGKNKKALKDIKKRAESLLKSVGLTGRLNHRPAELSGGESQRVAIARSLINSPEILLCDEPTGNLDSKIGNEIMDCLWALRNKENMALCMVTHDECLHNDFDKRFKIRDGSLEENIGKTIGEKNGTEGLHKWQVCR